MVVLCVRGSAAGPCEEPRARAATAPPPPRGSPGLTDAPAAVGMDTPPSGSGADPDVLPHRAAPSLARGSTKENHPDLGTCSVGNDASLIDTLKIET